MIFFSDFQEDRIGTCQRGLGCTAGELLPVLWPRARAVLHGGERHNGPHCPPLPQSHQLSLNPFQCNFWLFHCASQTKKNSKSYYELKTCKFAEDLFLIGGILKGNTDDSPFSDQLLPAMLGKLWILVFTGQRKTVFTRKFPVSSAQVHLILDQASLLMDEVLFKITTPVYHENWDQKAKVPEFLMCWRPAVRLFPSGGRCAHLSGSQLAPLCKVPVSFFTGTCELWVTPWAVSLLKPGTLSHLWDAENELKQMGISRLQIVGN